MMRTESKGLNPPELAHKWMKDLGTRPQIMRVLSEADTSCIPENQKVPEQATVPSGVPAKPPQAETIREPYGYLPHLLHGPVPLQESPGK